MGAFEYGCRHGHANYNLRVLGQMRGLGTDVWVFFSLPFSITLRVEVAIVSWVSCISGFLFSFSLWFLGGRLYTTVVARMRLWASRISASLLFANISFQTRSRARSTNEATSRIHKCVTGTHARLINE